MHYYYVRLLSIPTKVVNKKANNKQTLLQYQKQQRHMVLPAIVVVLLQRYFCQTEIAIHILGKKFNMYFENLKHQLCCLGLHLFYKILVLRCLLLW